MNNTFAVITEIVILIFNLLIFMQLTIPKKDTIGTKILMYVATLLFLTAYFVATFVFKLPEMASSFICITLPSVVLFFLISQYKDSRFLVTFCFLDTVTLIITFCSRALDMLYGMPICAVGYIAACLTMMCLYFFGKPYYRRYRELAENVKDGWAPMAVSTCLIYILLVACSAYPAPMKDRVEYIPTYLLLCIIILSAYIVFIVSIYQKKKVYDMNVALQNAQKWHKIAYVDALTGMKNRMAYVETINELSRSDRTSQMFAVMLDIDNFKTINDSLGHHVGDITLQKAADYLDHVFQEKETFHVFRIGGDEFAVVAVGISQDALDQKIALLSSEDTGKIAGCSFSVGYSEIIHTQNNRIENAFIRADHAMYESKTQKKHQSHQ